MKSRQSMKTALVLSAGGMFGAYQAGAWNVLAREFHPDIVVGTSVGALNGWAIAGGCSPQDLIAQWMDPATAGLMRMRWPPAWSGFLDPAPLQRRAQDLFASYSPRVPFGVVVVELAKLRARLFQDAELNWRHLVASCAFPTGFPPVRIGGKLYVDGGLSGVLPIWAAAEMGASRVIAINALPLMPSRIVRALVRAVRRISPDRRSSPSLDALVISPSQPMGSLQDLLLWDRQKVQGWIEMGQRDVKYFLCQHSGSIG